MRVLGLLLDVEVDVVLLHIQVNGGSRIAVHRRLETANRCSFTWAGGI